MELAVREYAPELLQDWEHVLAHGKNGLFLFDRKFIEYHGDRFRDYSLVGYLDGEPVALFPVAQVPGTGEIISHPGLTFGGVVVRRDLRSECTIALVGRFLDALKAKGVEQLTVRLVPPLLASYPSGDIEYALWRHGFALSRRDLSSVLPLNNALPLNTSKRQAVAKARKVGVVVGTPTVDAFHQLLSEVLGNEHGVEPVHSAAELDVLLQRFPAHIRLVGGWLGDRLVAASMVFDYGRAWHTQYLAACTEGRKHGALDLVISEIRDAAANAGAEYLSFGVSTSDQGRSLNEGLLWQKESHGARSITHDFMTGRLSDGH